LSQGITVGEADKIVIPLGHRLLVAIGPPDGAHDRRRRCRYVQRDAGSRSSRLRSTPSRSEFRGRNRGLAAVLAHMACGTRAGARSEGLEPPAFRSVGVGRIL